MNRFGQLIISIILTITLFSCKKTVFKPETQNNPEAIFDNFWNDFNVNYPNMQNRGVNWDSLYYIYKPVVSKETTDDELYYILSKMIKALNDGHVALVAPNRNVYRSNIYYREKIEDDLFNLEVIKNNYLGSNVETSYEEINTYGKIGNVGYFHFKWVHENLVDFENILNSISSTDGLIIDLRHNGGGNFTYGLTELGRLVEIEQFIFREKTKNGTGQDDFTPWYYWSIFPSGDFYNKPIVVLIDRYTISAGERLALVFKALPNCTLVGDTTNGAISTKIGRELPNGWSYTFAPQVIEFIDGNNYEGTGIPPDIYSKNDLSEISGGTDETLEVALSMF